MTTSNKRRTHRATLLGTLAAAALASALSATPVFAQAAIQEPGMFAFYHPYLDVLNGGAPTPASRIYGDVPQIVVNMTRSGHHGRAAR